MDRFLSSIVKSIGVVSGTVEPCLYVGRMVGKDQAPIVIMAYVDDLLVATTSESALKTLMTALSAHVKVRETGRVGLKGDTCVSLVEVSFEGQAHLLCTCRWIQRTWMKLLLSLI